MNTNILSKEERIALRNELKTEIDNNKISYNKIVRFLNSDEILKIKWELYMSQFSSKEEAIFCLNHNDDPSNHLCPICGKQKPFYVNKTHREYKKTCGSVDCIEKRANSEEALQKSTDTCMKNFGCKRPLQNQEIMNKMIQTNMKNLGVPYTVVHPEIIKTIKQSILNKFHVENVSALPEIRSKIRESNILRRNFENIIKDEEFERFINKFNNIYHQNIQILNIYTNDEYFIKFIKHLYKNRKRLLKLKEVANLFNFNNSNIIRRRIDQLNLLEYFNIRDSKLELQFKELLENNNIIDFKRHDRTINDMQFEIDFYLKNYNIGIEINDILTHNIKKRGNDYHFNKSFLCKEKGIRLIHLWEWELTDKNLWNKTSNWILNLFNNQKVNINSKDCIIKEIDKETIQHFINKYNLYNYVESNINFGLYCNNELLQAITFKYYDNKQYELLQFCTKYEFEIKDGAKELINHFIQQYNPSSIITIVNLDKFNGTTFEEIGFKLVDKIEPFAIYNHNDVYISDYKQLYNCGANVYVLYK